MVLATKLPLVFSLSYCVGFLRSGENLQRWKREGRTIEVLVESLCLEK